MLVLTVAILGLELGLELAHWAYSWDSEVEEHLSLLSVPIVPYSLDHPLELPEHLVDLLELQFLQLLQPSYAPGSPSLGSV